MRMPIVMVTTAVAGLALAGAADAQRIVQRTPGATYGMPGARPVPPSVHAPRWGSKVDGRWWGGANAPGGWRAYRRPTRGYALPTYWNAPRFYITDWSTYGLAQPPQGYRWTRYYDDAVLIDGRGSVYDSQSAVDWDRFDDDGYYASEEVAYAGVAPPSPPRPLPPVRQDSGVGGAAIGAVAGGVAGNLIAGRGNRLGGTLIGAGLGAAAGYAVDKAEDRGRRASPPPLRPLPPVRQDSGVGGAAIGAVAGGVAGNLIAGRGNRLGGTLIGAGVGAAAGYAIDKAEDRGRRAPPPLRDRRDYDAPPPGYGAEYDVPMAPNGPPPRLYRDDDMPPPPMAYRDGSRRDHGGRWVSPDGRTTVVTTGGYPYGAPVFNEGPGGTTITIQNAPSVTTTTTTTYEDVVTYQRPVYRKKSRSKLVRR